jgi:hypothetical protein
VLLLPVAAAVLLLLLLFVILMQGPIESTVAIGHAVRFL